MGVWGCTARVPQPGQRPVVVEAPKAAPLPPIPSVLGRLTIRVVYPPTSETVAGGEGDSSLVFGSVGSGDASLTINGHPVAVNSNGSFLAQLPIPSRADPFFDVVATRGRDTARVRHPVRLARSGAELMLPGSPLLDSTSIFPNVPLVRRGSEVVRVGLRSGPGSTAVLVTDRGRIPLDRRERGARADSLVRFNEIAAAQAARARFLLVTRGADTVTMPAPQVALSDSLERALGVVSLHDGESVISQIPADPPAVRPVLIPRGTLLAITGRTGDSVRLRLDRQSEVWVDGSVVGAAADTARIPSRVLRQPSVRSTSLVSELILPVGAALPYSVEPTQRGMVLRLHGATLERAGSGLANDSLVERVTLAQERADLVSVEVDFTRHILGYRVRYDAGSLVVSLRPVPRVDSLRPLAGLTIVVDAGHPPGGATGPTGYYEPVATLSIGQRLRTALEQRGARVVLTRDGPSALGTDNRFVVAMRANAHALVSVHLSPEEGSRDLLASNGTQTSFVGPLSLDLARTIQHEVLAGLGLSDLGLLSAQGPRSSVAGWFPAVVSQGALIIVPQQEAALRTAEFQERYAVSLARGLERYFAALRDAH